MQTGLLTWTTENQQRATTLSSTDVAQHSARVSRSRPQLLFLHQKQNYQGIAAAAQKALYLKQLLEDFGIQQKHPIAIGADNQSCIKLIQNQSCTRGANTLRQNFTSFRTRRKMGLFQFITFLLTKWQPISPRNLYPYRRWRDSELFWWEQTLRNQLKSEWGVRISIKQ